MLVKKGDELHGIESSKNHQTKTNPSATTLAWGGSETLKFHQPTITTESPKSQMNFREEIYDEIPIDLFVLVILYFLPW